MPYLRRVCYSQRDTRKTEVEVAFGVLLTANSGQACHEGIGGRIDDAQLRPIHSRTAKLFSGAQSLGLPGTASSEQGELPLGMIQDAEGPGFGCLVDT